VRKVHGKPAGCQDIVIAPDGNTLYVSLSGVNEVAVVHLDEEGHPSLIQEVSCRGKFPRCLQFTPEGRYLLIGNMISGDIAEYQIEENGKLKDSGRKFKAVSPSAIRFYETENREE
jgi:6-phosphogluconolactonase (cycloisomerase 2 family)